MFSLKLGPPPFFLIVLSITKIKLSVAFRWNNSITPTPLQLNMVIQVNPEKGPTKLDCSQTWSSGSKELRRGGFLQLKTALDSSALRSHPSGNHTANHKQGISTVFACRAILKRVPAKQRLSLKPCRSAGEKPFLSHFSL